MRVLTVELSRRSKAVVQEKGRFKREPTEAESAVVEQWQHEVALRESALAMPWRHRVARVGLS